MDIENGIYEVGKIRWFSGEMDDLSDVEADTIIDIPQDVDGIPAGEYIVIEANDEMLEIVPTTNLDYGLALVLLDEGWQVRRKGWANEWIIKITSLEWNCHITGLDGVTLGGFTAVKTADNVLIPWTPSQADMWANDWELVQNEQEDNAS